MTEKQLDFEKVELVRERMGLSISDMAKLLNTTRVTYYKWVEGGPIRASNAQKVKDALRMVLPLLKSGTWPPVGAAQMNSAQRLASLLEILEAE